MSKVVSAIDDVLIVNQNWLTRGFVRELAIINMLSHEVRPDGTGFVDHPNDPGGATNYGISLRFLQTDGAEDGDIDRDGDIDADDIRALTINQAADLYSKHFWQPYGIADLPPRMAVKVFDMAVNMGPRQAIKIFQRSLNMLNEANLLEDGVIGPKTLAEAKFFSSHWHMEKFMDQIRDDVLGFYLTLVRQKPDLSVFINGWKKRALS